MEDLKAATEKAAAEKAAAEKAAAEKAAAEKAAAEKAAAEKAAAEKAAAEKAAAEKAAAEKAAAEKAAAEKAAAEKAAAEKAAAEKAAAEKAAAEKAAAEKAAAEKAAAEKAAAEKAASEKAAAEAIAQKPETEPTPTASVSYTPPPPRKPADPVERTMKYAAAGIGLLIFLIVAASISNSGNYYLKDANGGLEIWQGSFAPLGEKHLLTLPGVPAPEEIQDVYTQKEVFPLAFNYYLVKADTLLEADGLPDFDGIKTYASQARAFAVDKEMRTLAQIRSDKIDWMILVYKADMAMARGKMADLLTAQDYLEDADRYSADDLDEDIIANKLAEVEAAIVAEEARMAEEAAAAEEEAARLAEEEAAAAEAVSEAAEGEAGEGETEAAEAAGGGVEETSAESEVAADADAH
jgi:hypothetical protein